ncbi:hypothetical protein BGS_0308 [Beggiatoa sp. SS]|nr:hypothetical protein BGS_0308 [Beggiatoa sp. SS]
MPKINIWQQYENLPAKNYNRIILPTHSPHILASAKTNSIRLLNFQ